MQKKNITTGNPNIIEKCPITWLNQYLEINFCRVAVVLHPGISV
jgi:hypothetical protein